MDDELSFMLPFSKDQNFLMLLILHVGNDESTRYSNRYHQFDVKVKGVVYRISNNFWYFKTDTFVSRRFIITNGLNLRLIL